LPAAIAITRVRDNALITLGRTWAQLNAALLAAATAHRLAGAGHPAAQAWGCAVKAHGADAAYQAASELALLAGAAGFTAASRTAKTRSDLNALLYADGIHDSLYRAAGRTLTGLPKAAAPEPALPAVPAMRDGRDQALAPARRQAGQDRTSELAAAFTRFAAGRCGSYAPLYAQLASGIADDRELLAIAAHARPPRPEPARPDARRLLPAPYPRLLGRALRAAARPPAPVHAGDATAILPALVTSAPAGTAVCVMHTAFLAHLAPPDRARFEHQVVALSAGRPVCWISAETRADPAGPRLRLASCVTERSPASGLSPATSRTAHGPNGQRKTRARRVPRSERQAAGPPFSSAPTAPASSASRHDATRRASSGVTSPATSSPGTNANPASSPSASTISLTSASDSTPPS
jgi:hypothetical protein